MKNYKKILAGATAIAISAGATGTIAYAKNNDKSSSPENAPEKEEISASSRAALDEAPYKDETVYVLCKNDSSVKDVIVSDWLKNAPALTSLEDISELSDIVNVKGDESFSLYNSSLTWNAEGNDI